MKDSIALSVYLIITGGLPLLVALEVGAPPLVALLYGVGFMVCALLFWVVATYRWAEWLVFCVGVFGVVGVHVVGLLFG